MFRSVRPGRPVSLLFVPSASRSGRPGRPAFHFPSHPLFRPALYLPNDPDMLFSMLNMKLRDQYDSFEDLCDSEDIDPAPVLVKLNAAGYVYDESHNCFQYAEVLDSESAESL